MSHPGVGLDKWEDLPHAKPVYVGAGAINTFYGWLRLAYGFKDEAIRPYKSIRRHSFTTRCQSSRVM